MFSQNASAAQCAVQVSSRVSQQIDVFPKILELGNQGRSESEVDLHLGRSREKLP
jgi:hypothetical protein